jgi:hypothetical protein
MTPLLSESGYEQTKRKLANLERRMESLAKRDDLKPPHREEAIRSLRDMMQQYSREIKLYEAHAGTAVRSE